MRPSPPSPSNQLVVFLRNRWSTLPLRPTIGLVSQPDLHVSTHLCGRLLHILLLCSCCVVVRRLYVDRHSCIIIAVHPAAIDRQKCKEKLVKPTKEQRFTTSSKYGFSGRRKKLVMKLFRSMTWLVAGSKYVIEKDGLLVRGVERADAGTYTCR